MLIPFVGGLLRHGTEFTPHPLDGPGDFTITEPYLAGHSILKGVQYLVRSTLF